MATQVVNGLSGAIGCRFLPTHNQLLFVEYGGKVSVLDLIRPYVATVSAGSTVLQGTATFDLDTGTQHTGTPPGDLWWEQQTATVRDMKPMGGAKIVNLGHVDFNAVTAVVSTPMLAYFVFHTRNPLACLASSPILSMRSSCAASPGTK